MRIFALRLRRGPTSAEYIEKSIGGDNHFEIAAHGIANAFYISKHIRRDIVFHTVLEGPPCPPIIVSLDSREEVDIGGFDEKTILSLIKTALNGSSSLKPNETYDAGPGLRVTRRSFESLVREISAVYPTFILSRKGTDIRGTDIPGDCCFLLTDHIPMQKKTFHLLERLGVKKISLGPTTLFTSQCIVLVHNELDRKMGKADIR